MIHIKNIIKGWWRLLFNRKDNFSKARREICKTCEFNDNNWCLRCGCFIPAKSKVKEEMCYENKWM